MISRYVRSRKGGVVHRATCPDKGKARPWQPCPAADDRDLARYLAENRLVRACPQCLADVEVRT